MRGRGWEENVLKVYQSLQEQRDRVLQHYAPGNTELLNLFWSVPGTCSNANFIQSYWILYKVLKQRTAIGWLADLVGWPQHYTIPYKRVSPGSPLFSLQASAERMTVVHDKRVACWTLWAFLSREPLLLSSVLIDRNHMVQHRNKEWDKAHGCCPSHLKTLDWPHQDLVTGYLWTGAFDSGYWSVVDLAVVDTGQLWIMTQVLPVWGERLALLSPWVLKR